MVVYVVLRVIRSAKIRYFADSEKCVPLREKINNNEPAIHIYFVPLPGNPGLGSVLLGNAK